MPRQKSLNFVKLNEELFASDAVIDPILASAKLTTLKVDGKDVVATDAPMPVKLAAIGALLASGDKTHDAAELIAANGQLAEQAEQLQAGLVTTKATVTSLQQKNSQLESELTTARASVQSLTSANGTANTLLEASNKEVTRLQKQVNDLNREVSKVCVASGCLELKGEDGKAIPATAAEDVKLAAADKISVTDKLNAHLGAVNSAVARITGVPLNLIPNAGPGGEQKPTLSALAQYEAITDSQARVEFYRKNKAAIDACYRK